MPKIRITRSSAELGAEAGAEHLEAGILASEAALALSEAGAVEASETFGAERMVGEWYDLYLENGRHLEVGPDFDERKVARLLRILQTFDRAGGAEMGAETAERSGVEAAEVASPEAAETAGAEAAEVASPEAAELAGAETAEAAGAETAEAAAAER